MIVRTPDTGVTVTLKGKLTWGDSKSVDWSLPQPSIITMVLGMVVQGWDLEEPFTVEKAEELLTVDDVLAIVGAVIPNPEKKREVEKALVSCIALGSAEVPVEYIEFELKERFGWTEQELESQSFESIEYAKQIIHLQNQKAKQERN